MGNDIENHNTYILFMSMRVQSKQAEFDWCVLWDCWFEKKQNETQKKIIRTKRVFCFGEFWFSFFFFNPFTLIIFMAFSCLQKMVKIHFYGYQNGMMMFNGIWKWKIRWFCLYLHLILLLLPKIQNFCEALEIRLWSENGMENSINDEEK